MNDIRKYITLIESSSTLVDSAFIDRLVMSIHPREEDFSDGDLLHRIDRYSTYRLQEIPIDRLVLDEFDIDEDHVQDVIERIESGESISPIVYDPEDNSIIDGNHRANAYHLMGKLTIPAYVGVEANPEWDDD